jgi:hypothetical protein
MRGLRKELKISQRSSTDAASSTPHLSLCYRSLPFLSVKKLGKEGKAFEIAAIEKQEAEVPMGGEANYCLFDDNF